MELPKRKINRLTEYDYSTPNAYFITICTDKRKNLFWNSVGAIIDRHGTERYNVNRLHSEANAVQAVIFADFPPRYIP